MRLRPGETGAGCEPPSRTNSSNSAFRPVQLPLELEATLRFRLERLVYALDFVFRAILIRVAHAQSARRCSSSVRGAEL